MVSQLHALQNLMLFQDLSPKELATVEGLLRRKTFSVGVDIITAEQPGEIAYIIVSGTVKIYTQQADGSTVVLAILGPGEMVGEMSLLENSDRSATVVTLEETTVYVMSRASFETCLQSMPMLTYNLVRMLSRRLRMAGAQVQALASLDVFGRVARQIVAFAHEYGQKRPDGHIFIPLLLTQSDLAGLVGASRVRVNQVLMFFRQQGSITIDQDHRITVIDLAALQQRSQ